MFDGKAFGEEIVGFVREYLEKEVAPLKARIAELEAREPVQGPPGEKGESGEPGEPGKDGSDGADGKDGAGIIDAFISREGHLIASLSDGTTKDLGEIIGKDGRDGEKGADGKDAFGLDDYDEWFEDDGRTLVRRFIVGDDFKEFRHQTVLPRYRNVFKDGQNYQRGDIVTFGGIAWHCEKDDTTEKPGVGADWAKMVNKGRDGKNANG